MYSKPVLALFAVLFCAAVFAVSVQSASCTETNPDWVYVATVKGTESQYIDIDQLIPQGYHWGVRGAYTSVGNATFGYEYNH